MKAYQKFIRLFLSCLTIHFIGLLFSTHGEAQSKKNDTTNSRGSFIEIRNKDFAQLIGATNPGISINFNSGKSTLVGDFFIKVIDSSSRRPIWFQLSTSVGTTSTIYKVGGDALQPTFSILPSVFYILRNNYYYDGDFGENYSTIQGNGTLPTTNAGFTYTQALRNNLQKVSPSLSKSDSLYTAKRIEWLSILPEYTGAKYNFYDKTRSFKNQFYEPYDHLWGINIFFNHYWYVNNEDVDWKGGYTTRFFYYKIGFKYGQNNNVDLLKRTDFQDVLFINYNPDSSIRRQTVKSTSAYTDMHITYKAVSPSFELLYSFTNFVALNAFGNYNIITSKESSIRNNGSIAAGLYFYSKKSGSKINIGIYYRWSIEGSNVVQSVGLKSKVPINW